MTDTTKVWRGAVGIGSYTCDECGQHAAVHYQIARAPLHSESVGQWACRSCVLEPSRSIAAIDRRGDELHTPAQIARELDAQTAITLHLELQERATSTQHSGIDYGPPLEAHPLPADYLHVLDVLGKLSRADDEFASTATELRERYERAAFFTPKQVLLIQWRLTKHGVEHVPARFVVSTRSEKEIAQIRSFDDWRQKKIAPFLSWAQRSKFGF